MPRFLLLSCTLFIVSFNEDLDYLVLLLIDGYVKFSCYPTVACQLILRSSSDIPSLPLARSRSSTGRSPSTCKISCRDYLGLERASGQ